MSEIKRQNTTSLHNNSNLFYVLLQCELLSFIMWTLIAITLYDASNIAKPSAYQYLFFFQFSSKEDRITVYWHRYLKPTDLLFPCNKSVSEPQFNLLSSQAKYFALPVYVKRHHHGANSLCDNTQQTPQNIMSHLDLHGLPPRSVCSFQTGCLNSHHDILWFCLS